MAPKRADYGRYRVVAARYAWRLVGNLFAEFVLAVSLYSTLTNLQWVGT